MSRVLFFLVFLGGEGMGSGYNPSSDRFTLFICCTYGRSCEILQDLVRCMQDTNETPMGGCKNIRYKSERNIVGSGSVRVHMVV